MRRRSFSSSTRRVGSAADLRRRGAGVLRRSSRPPLRVDRIDGPDDQGVRRRHPRFRRRPRAGAGVVRQGTQGRCRPAVPGPVHRQRGTAVRRPSAGEGAGVAHAATYTPQGNPTRGWFARPSSIIYFYSLYEDDGFGPPFIKFSTYFLLHRQTLYKRATSAAKRQAARRGSLSRPWTTDSPRSTMWIGCRTSATAWDRTRSTRCCANGYASCPTRSPTTTKQPATATNCRS